MAHFGCPRCSATVEVGSATCPQCGADLAGLTKTPGRMVGGRLTFILIVVGVLFALAMGLALVERATGGALTVR